MRLPVVLALALAPGLVVAACGGRVGEEPSVDPDPTVTPTTTAPPPPTTTATPPPTTTTTTPPTSPSTPPTTPPPDSPPDTPTTSPFDALRAGVVGRWFGTATSPWGSWQLWLDLHGDGHYNVKCVGECLAFYYGDDSDSSLKRYVLTDLTAAGEGTGDIDITWPDRGAATRGELHRVSLTPDRNTLRFEFFPTWLDGKVGPIRYMLKRVS